MAKLSELVKFRNDLRDTIKDLSIDDIISEKKRLTEIIRCRHNLPEYDSYIDGFVSAYQNLLDKNNNIINVILESIKKVEGDIDLQVKNTIQPEATTSQFLSTNPELENLILSRISGYSDWRFPGMQLNCRYFQYSNNKILSEYAIPKDRINSMVANDPLYLIGDDMEHLTESIVSYPEIYRRRLRLYKITDNNLTVIPQNQFGFILCWDFLNYLPTDQIEKYLRSILSLLRPGGVFMFSYNNCDVERSAQMVDDNEACWMTTPILHKMISDIGFEIITFIDVETKDIRKTWVSWGEIKKPGVLCTIKRQQAVGEVLTK
jgi:SAM-dependent methyltransferase